MLQCDIQADRHGNHRKDGVIDGQFIPAGALGDRINQEYQGHDKAQMQRPQLGGRHAAGKGGI